MNQTFYTITSVALLLMGGRAMGQTETPAQAKLPITIGITGGFTSASGNFAATDYSSNKSGYASSGFNLGITGTYMLNKHWGITALASYHKYASASLQSLAAGYKEDFAIDSSTVYSVGSTYTMNVMVGPYYTIPVSEQFSVDLRGLAGLTNAHLAGNRVDVEDNAASSFEQKAATANTIGYQLGAAAKYKINKRFGVSLNLDYYYSRPDFKVDNVNRRNNAGRLVTKYNEPIAGINANVSFVYALR